MLDGRNSIVLRTDVRHCSSVRLDFFCKFLWMIPQQTSTFFLHRVHSVIFFAHLCWQFEGGGKSNSSRSIFRLNSIHLCGTWMQLYLILSVLLPIFTHITVILRGQVVCSPQRHAEKKWQRSAWTQPIYFNATCFFCRYLRKKSQCVALALHSKFLHVITSSEITLVTWCSSRWCYITVLYYMSVNTFKFWSAFQSQNNHH